MESNDQTKSSVPYSRPTCEPCRQRKVRCNRGTPCSQCSRLQLSCIYETRKRRAPLRPAASSQPVLQDSVPSTLPVSPGSPAQASSSNQDVLDRLTSIEALLSDIRGSLPSGEMVRSAVEQSQSTQAPIIVPPTQPSEAPADHQVRGNYVDNSVFVGLLLGGTSQQGSESILPPVGASKPQNLRIPTNHGITVTDVFGPPVDSLNISCDTYSNLWELYKKNFDPLVKILHIPTIHPVLLEASLSPGEADDTTMALLCAVCFAAVSTATKADVLHQSLHTKSSMLRHFMQEMDGRFMRAQLILRPNTLTLTAFVIYLTALRTHDATRTVWILIGLAKRIAESLGLHEDGARLRLSPFDIEMRRRLWWHLTALEATAPENHGFNTSFIAGDQQFPLPSNINDEDIRPRMTEHATKNEMWTETSFSIMNLDLCRRLRSAVATNSPGGFNVQMNMIEETEQVMSQQLLRFADMEKLICRAADALLRISILKAQFILKLQRWLSTGVGSGSQYSDLPQSIFTTAIKLLEDGYLLQSGNLFPNFAWFYQQHPQLYALFLVLRTLHASPVRAESDRAWLAVDNYFTCLADFEEAAEMKGRTSCVWAVLNPLRDKARESSSKMGHTTQGPTSSTYTDLESIQSVSPHPDPAPSIPAFESGVHLPFTRANQPSLEYPAFDDVLSWQDFTDWFNMDIGNF